MAIYPFSLLVCRSLHYNSRQTNTYHQHSFLPSAHTLCSLYSCTTLYYGQLTLSCERSGAANTFRTVYPGPLRRFFSPERKDLSSSNLRPPGHFLNMSPEDGGEERQGGLV